MTQYDFGNMDPTATSGSALATKLNNKRDAADTTNSGGSRPSYVQAGMVWLRTVSSTLWELYLYDGATDILQSRFNPTQHTFEPNFDAQQNLASAATTDLGSLLCTFIKVTGTVGITSFGTEANLFRVVQFGGVLTISHDVSSLILLIGKNRTTAAGDIGIYRSDGSGNWREIAYQRANPVPSTRQILASGSSATYTAPANCLQLRVRMVGGGGGGGSQSGGASNGSNGGTSAFNGITAIGGSGGNSNGNAGVGGTGGNNTPTSGSVTGLFRTDGNAGGPGGPATVSTAADGGNGGGSIFGGGAANTNSAKANTGGGGSGQGVSSTAAYSGGGGGAGEAVEFFINAPASTYTYTVGSAASGGLGAGNGGSGVIIVDEIY